MLITLVTDSVRLDSPKRPRWLSTPTTSMQSRRETPNSEAYKKNGLCGSRMSIKDQPQPLLSPGCSAASGSVKKYAPSTGTYKSPFVTNFLCETAVWLTRGSQIGLF